MTPEETKKNFIPVPDPTALTTEALRREIAGLHDLLNEKLKLIEGAGIGAREVLEERLTGMDRAVKLLQDTADKFPARIDEKINALKSVHEEMIGALEGVHVEKFSSIQTQFRERDVRTEQSSKDSKVAVDAALQAAKEAVGEQNKSSALAIAKSEAATAKQIDGLVMQLQSMTKGLDDKITDVKDRLTRIEGGSSGKKDMWGYVVGAIGMVVLVLGLFLPFAQQHLAPASAPPIPSGYYLAPIPVPPSAIPAPANAK